MAEVNFSLPHFLQCQFKYFDKKIAERHSINYFILVAEANDFLKCPSPYASATN